LRRRQNISDHLIGKGMYFDFFDALDGNSLANIDAHFVCGESFLEETFSYRERKIEPAELACTLSHMQAIQGAWTAGRKGPLLVLEDDAILCPTDTHLLEKVIQFIPHDAAYVQFALTPTNTIIKLGAYFAEGGEVFAEKTSPISLTIGNDGLNCHCTAAYLITNVGMQTISDAWFDGDMLIFPCKKDSVKNNVSLVADRFVYQAASSRGGVGYVCTVPMFTTAATESSIHPDHVHWHEEARDTALDMFSSLQPILISRLTNALKGSTAS
jgi:GR25 family glycosyltransferase involved in LPS biosynthesis